jgi:hypothetical protein
MRSGFPTAPRQKPPLQVSLAGPQIVPSGGVGPDGSHWPVAHETVPPDWQALAAVQVLSGPQGAQLPALQTSWSPQGVPSGAIPVSWQKPPP